MVNDLTEAVRKHHVRLAKTSGAHARRVDRSEPQIAREASVDFLKGDLVPPTIDEERHPYVLVDRLARRHGGLTATMIVDHEFINDHVTAIEAITPQLDIASDGERSQLLRRLRDLAQRLDATARLLSSSIGCHVAGGRTSRENNARY